MEASRSPTSLESARSPKVMAISIRPYLTGAPHRIRYLEKLYDCIADHDGVVVCTGSQSVDFSKGYNATSLNP